MKNLQYREFLALVLEAQGPFGCLCFGKYWTTDPVLYLARHWPNGILQKALESRLYDLPTL